MKIHITGASGSGTTTLAKALAKHYNCVHFDSDNYFWLQTEIPYTQQRPIDQRRDMLLKDLNSCKDWILSGCNQNWPETNTDDLYDLVIFLYVPHKERMERLRIREIERFGEQALATGGHFYKNHIEFMEWASSYDSGDLSIRSKLMHENWLKTLQCPVLRLEGFSSLEQNLDNSIKFIDQEI